MIGLSEHFTYKKLILFTLPTIVMMIFTSIYGVVDGLFISNVEGSDAFAAVNLIMPAIMILGAIGFMIGTGGAALIAKTLGEQDRQKANRIFSMLIYFLGILGVIISVIGVIFIEPIAHFLGAEGEILQNCVIYGRTLFLAMVPFFIQNAFQSFLVVAEKPTFGLVISIFSGATNVLLDFLLIYVLRWGVFGAAIATLIAQVVGAVIPLCYFIRPNRSPLRLVKTGLEWQVIKRSCINGSSEMLTNASTSLVNMLYNSQLMQIAGADGVVSYGIIMYVGFLFSGTYMGYSMGVAPIIGYHYGAGNQDELKNLWRKSLRIIIGASIIMTTLAEILAKILAGIFVSYNAELLEMTAAAIRLFALSYLVSGINIFASSFFTALNNGFVSALISFLRTLVFQIIMILVLPAIWGLNGIWLAVVFAELLALGVSIACFVKNRNKYRYY